MGTMVVLVFNLISDIFSPFQLVVDIYSILICGALALIEMSFCTCKCFKNRKGCLLTLRLKLIRWFNFLTRAWGQGALCIYVGSLLLAKWSILKIIAGVYMLCIGVIMVIYGYHAERTIKKMAASDDKFDFESMDANNDGYIDLDEVRVACSKRGMPMSKNHLVMAFGVLDVDKDGRVDREEFARYFQAREV